MSASTEFAASLPFFSYRQRNAVIDNFFYDTASLTLEEKAKLSPLVDREGSIIVVPPSNSDRKIRHYKSALRFRNKEGPTIRAIAVAGVALGSAALARNIADALNTDVAGIVTGYGLSDVMTEAFGGWFAFGAADRIKYTMEKFFERMRSTMPADAAPAAGDASATLCEILLAGPPKLEYLVAHSMGSLVVSHAPALCRGSGRRRERFVRALAHHHTRGRGRAAAYVQEGEAIPRLSRLVWPRQFKPRRDARARARGWASSQSRHPVSHERRGAVERRSRSSDVAETSRG